MAGLCGVTSAAGAPGQPNRAGEGCLGEVCEASGDGGPDVRRLQPDRGLAVPATPLGAEEDIEAPALLGQAAVVVEVGATTPGDRLDDAIGALQPELEVLSIGAKRVGGLEHQASPTEPWRAVPLAEGLQLGQVLDRLGAELVKADLGVDRHQPAPAAGWPEARGIGLQPLDQGRQVLVGAGEPGRRLVAAAPGEHGAADGQGVDPAGPVDGAGRATTPRIAPVESQGGHATAIAQ